MDKHDVIVKKVFPIRQANFICVQVIDTPLY